MIKGIIYDMDGVLMDSEVQSTIQHIVIAKRFNIVFSQHELDSFLGVPLIDIWGYAKSKHTIPYTAQELVDMEVAIMKEKFHNGEIKAVKGAFESVIYFKNKGYCVGIASSNFDFNINSALRHNNAQNYIDAYVCCFDVEKHKPNPDIFLCCAQKLGLKAEECVVIEDSLNGVKGAKAANMKIIAYCPSFASDELASLSDYVLKDFNLLTEEIIYSIS